MTREEAINKIGELVVYARTQGWDDDYTEAFDVLQQEPCEDAISRQAVLAYIERILTHGFGKKKSFEFIKKFVEKLPSVTPNQESCEECEVGNPCLYCKHEFEPKMRRWIAMKVEIDPEERARRNE